ncbi:MAG: FixH family protein [Sulfurovum sp.]|nr:FixH family protein [Sulfurovum sp.]
METKSKKTYWPHMIVGFLLLALTLSFWTVKSASSLPVQEVNDYMMKYQQADIHINDILEKKAAFDALYNIEILGTQMMVMTDNIHSNLPQPNVIKLSQGKNTFTYTVKKNEGKIVEDANVSFLLTRPHSRKDDVMIENISFKDGVYRTSVDIQKEGRYTLQFRAIMNENTIGYLQLPAYLKL